MGGFFGVASKQDCVLELFYGVDYHSHLGTRRGGMAVYGEDGFYRAIHNIENSPFRTKFDHDVAEMKGYLGIGCISDYDPQPLLIQSHLGSFAITTVGKVNNYEELLKGLFEKDHSHFQEMTNGQINVTELVAALICEKESIAEGIKYVQDVVDGSMTMLVMTKEGIYGARDRYGRTPLVIGKKDDSYCLSFESHAYINLGYTDYKELGPCEVVYVTSEGVEEIRPARTGKMKICSFLWVYYGYPTSAYEGVNVEEMRYRCGSMLAKRDGDSVHPDIVAGVPDSGIAHAIGYANESGIPYARPFIKYTPTWPRSFMPTNQSQRDLIARMKLIPVQALIEDKKSYMDLATKRTSTWDGCGVHNSGCKDQMAEVTAKIADIENEICAKIDRLLDYKKKVSKVIEQIEDKECQKILVLKFARYMPMVDIADKMNMDRSTVYRKYNKAIKAVQEILSESDKEKQ